MNFNSMINMKKLLQSKPVIFMLLAVFISGSFMTMVSFVSAQNVAEDSWNTKAPLNVARYGMGVIEVDGKIYAIGGIAEGRHTNANERYDPKADKWVILTPMPTSRAGIALAAYQHKIYCIGGTGYDANAQGWVEVYDIATDSWAIKSYAPINTLGSTQAHTIDGKIFVTHRSINKGNTLFDLYMYDPTTDSWTTKTGIQEKLMLISESFMMDNKLSVIGMFPDYTFAYKMLIYEPTIDSWSERATVERISPYNIGVTSGVYAPQKIYFFPMMPNRPIQVYDPVSGIVVNATDMVAIDVLMGDGTSVAVGRSSFSVVVVDDVFYVMGGLANGESVALNNQYVPMGYQGPLVSTFFSLDNRGFLVTLTALVGIIVVVGLVTYFKRRNRI